MEWKTTGKDAGTWKEKERSIGPTNGGKRV
jgi:hypothetical protein